LRVGMGLKEALAVWTLWRSLALPGVSSVRAHIGLCLLCSFGTISVKISVRFPVISSSTYSSFNKLVEASLSEVCTVRRMSYSNLRISNRAMLRVLRRGIRCIRL